MQIFINNHQKYFNKYTNIFTLILFVFFILVILPAESAKSLALGLEISPDTSIYYSASRLYEIAESYGIEGRHFYIRQRFTFDLLWPIVYGAFLFTSIIYFLQHINLSKRYYNCLWLPILAVIFDYLENMMTALVMFRFPYKTYLIDMLAGVMTLLKWITLLMAFIILVLLIGVYLYKKTIKIKKVD